jgi:hypothetical protein
MASSSAVLLGSSRPALALSGREYRAQVHKNNESTTHEMASNSQLQIKKSQWNSKLIVFVQIGLDLTIASLSSFHSTSEAKER